MPNFWSELCADCHEDQVNQFKKGKHALAWGTMNAMPTTHWKPMQMIEGQRGCGGCHKIGLKSEEDMRKLKTEGAGFGVASCDACHTRHLFSADEARQPQACQTCHMQEGNHEVRTAWGFLGVRTNGLAPYPGTSDEWWANQVTILQALGVLDPDGNPIGRLDVVAGADVARLSADVDRAAAFRDASETPDASLPRRVPPEPGLLPLVWLERNANGPDRYQGDGGGDEKSALAIMKPC